MYNYAVPIIENNEFWDVFKDVTVNNFKALYNNSMQKSEENFRLPRISQTENRKR